MNLGYSTTAYPQLKVYDVSFGFMLKNGFIISIQHNKKPLSKSAAGVEARDISGGYESSFVQVTELPKGTSSDKIKPAILSQAIFGSTGKFGYVN